MTAVPPRAPDPGAGWLRRSGESEKTLARVLAFAHAGAGASSFNGWTRLLPDWMGLVKVQLPGREESAALPAKTDLREVTGHLIPEIEGLLDKPLVTYGHCVGSLLSFEIARALRRRGRPLPAVMFVAARISPQTRPSVFLSGLPEPELVAELERMGAMSPLLTNERWRRYYLPVLRSDNALTDTYVYEDEPPLDCPLHMFVGASDRNREEAGWPDQTSRGFVRHVVDGGHFFSAEGTAEVVRTICDVTARAIRRDGAPL